jgi:NAD(P)-dependent dehydrogenase (short-subunit alcohol dehydrogenase family)
MSQVKIDSGFGPENTAENVIKGINLTGKIAIVTGGYTGLGLETTRILVSAGCKVIVPARTLDKATKNLAGISVEIEPMDLGNPSSIDAFADKFIK